MRACFFATEQIDVCFFKQLQYMFSKKKNLFSNIETDSFPNTNICFKNNYIAWLFKKYVFEYPNIVFSTLVFIVLCNVQFFAWLTHFVVFQMCRPNYGYKKTSSICFLQSRCQLILCSDLRSFF